MSRIKELLAELCPDGVEYKLLKNVAAYASQRISLPNVDITSDNYISVDNMLPKCQGVKEANYLPDKGSAIAFNKGDILIGNIRPYF